VRLLSTRSLELIRSQAAIFGVLAIWAFAPLVAVLVYVSQHGGVVTGVNGGDYFDQFQYLAWIRDEGSHLFASNLWVTGPTPHDYLHPMYAISGLLWRLGASIQLAYLIWKPIAVLVLFLGFAAYVRHLLPESRLQQAAALALALFYESPLFAVARWTGSVSPAHRYSLLLATDDANSALNLWGFEHEAIAIGLMPVFLIAADRLLATSADGRRPARGWTALAAASGLLVAWLHPWQGITLLAIAGGLFLVKPPRRRYRVLIAPAVAALLPLVYGVVLSRTDAAWRAFQTQTMDTGTAPLWALLASFGLLGVFAALGVRRPREDRDWMLVLWVVACAGVYFLIPEFPPHALGGLPLPLAVLAVRGWQRVRARMRVPGRVATPIAVLAVLAFTVPSAVDHAKDSSDVLANTISGALSRQLVRLTPNQAAALAYIDRSPRRGAVLAPWLVSLSVPGFTGRQAYAGHQKWQPHTNLSVDATFFSPQLKDPGGRLRQSILRQTKASFVFADCDAPMSLAQDIAPIARPVKRFGCVTVYETSH
jgi:hypothetical protein